MVMMIMMGRLLLLIRADFSLKDMCSSTHHEPQRTRKDRAPYRRQSSIGFATRLPPDMPFAPHGGPRTWQHGSRSCGLDMDTSRPKAREL